MPDATVAIVSRNRRERLRDAVRSACSQHGDIEVLVVDDGSTDGTAEMVRTEFQDVRLERFEESAGLVARRNDAARLAAGPIIFSIDDDATFSSPDVVGQGLDDFDDPRIAVVAMPYVDRLHGPEEHQRSPHAGAAFAVPTFRGTAYAVRRDAFLAIDGFREAIVHQGEEPDLALRLLDAGQVVRAGRADPIHHDESPSRNLDRMDIYGRRNEQLLSFTYFPSPWHWLFMAGYGAKGLLMAVRTRRPRTMLRGMADGVATCVRLRRQRTPVHPDTFALHRRLRRAGALPLDAIAPELDRRSGTQPEPAGERASYSSS